MLAAKSSVTCFNAKFSPCRTGLTKQIFFFFGDRRPSILIFFSFQKSLFDLIHLEGGEVAEY